VIGKLPRKKVLMEPRFGGRWREIAQDGTETVVARVIRWDPPNRVVFAWLVNADMHPDTTTKSELEVTFEDGTGTLVQLTCDKFDLMPVEYQKRLRDALANLWPAVLMMFATRVEFEASPL
jgi:uncharacterized protein YndB with AHSA1/START domain